MSRSRHIGLEQSETAVHGGRARDLARRRAVLEEELLTAYAEGDGERVSEARAALAGLADGGDEPPPKAPA